MKESKAYTYDDIFQRNIGIFTPEQQNIIKNLKVAVAGAGGLGGPVAYTLARLGVGEIRLADRDRFEASNLNRQSGAYLGTIGRFKAESVAEELKNINPDLRTVVLNDFLDENNIDNFLDGVDCVIDGIDFFALDADLLLHQKSRDRGLWLFTCQGASNITSFISFDPKGIALAERIMKNGKPDLGLAIDVMLPQLPMGVTTEMITEIIKTSEETGTHYIPSYSVIAPFNGSFVVENMVRVMVRKQEPIVSFPGLYYFDLNEMKSTFITGKASDK
jgi:molybdopterin/thiamine biosynthesis adenylyltransferase